MSRKTIYKEILFKVVDIWGIKCNSRRGILCEISEYEMQLRKKNHSQPENEGD
jgi:hypothetical protein